jgi:hypothetical protein
MTGSDVKGAKIRNVWEPNRRRPSSSVGDEAVSQDGRGFE